MNNYKDGERGGNVRVRTKIEKIDNKTLLVKDVPYGKTTASVIESILKAAEKGKIKIKKVEDNTASTAEIIVTLQPGTSSDKAIDALYAFSDCETSISPCCCVIKDEKPQFLNVSELLRYSVDRTKQILKTDLEYQRADTLESLLYASLEKSSSRSASIRIVATNRRRTSTQPWLTSTSVSTHSRRNLCATSRATTFSACSKSRWAES